MNVFQGNRNRARSKFGSGGSTECDVTQDQTKSADNKNRLHVIYMEIHGVRFINDASHVVCHPCRRMPAKRTEIFGHLSSQQAWGLISISMGLCRRLWCTTSPLLIEPNEKQYNRRIVECDSSQSSDVSNIIAESLYKALRSVLYNPSVDAEKQPIN